MSLMSSLQELESRNVFVIIVIFAILIDKKFENNNEFKYLSLTSISSNRYNFMNGQTVFCSKFYLLKLLGDYVVSKLTLGTLVGPHCGQGVSVIIR